MGQRARRLKSTRNSNLRWSRSVYSRIFRAEVISGCRCRMTMFPVCFPRQFSQTPAQLQFLRRK